jgi:hypothetical protein
MSYVRETLAATAARIIVESQLTDWQLARRKATSELGLVAHGTPQPTDDEIIAEIKTFHALYGAAEFAAQLQSQREYALEAMIELQRFRPVLTGPVAEGWAHAGSEIRIELDADNAKEIEYALIDLGVEFTPHVARGGSEYFVIDEADWPMKLVARSHARHTETKFKFRLDMQRLKDLLDHDAAMPNT